MTRSPIFIGLIAATLLVPLVAMLGTPRSSSHGWKGWRTAPGVTAVVPRQAPAPAAPAPAASVAERVCVTAESICAVTPSPVGSPCSCASTMRGWVPGYVELVGAASPLPHSAWRRDARQMDWDEVGGP